MTWNDPDLHDLLRLYMTAENRVTGRPKVCKAGRTWIVFRPHACEFERCRVRDSVHFTWEDARDRALNVAFVLALGSPRS